MVASLMMARPAAERMTAQTKHSQKFRRRSISRQGISSTASFFFPPVATASTKAASAVRSSSAPTSIMTAKATAKIKNVVRQPRAVMRLAPRVPSSIPPKPKPIRVMPETRPCLSGNQRISVEMVALYPRPTPKPQKPP